MSLLLIDGYNIIHALPRFRKALDVKLSEARSSLIGSLARLAEAKKGNVSIHIFFDSNEPHDFFQTDPVFPGVDVHFSEGESADETILHFLGNYLHKGDVTVVTDDRSLARRAGDEGAIVLSSAGLEHRLRKIGS